MRKVIVAGILTALFGGVVAIFWFQEIQYLLPTPVPNKYQVVLPNEIIKFDSALLPQKHERPKFLHFFSPNCPCSRFNLPHFNALTKTYSQQVDFYVVIEDERLVESAKKKIEGNVIIVIDKDQTLAKACGVYSTPQAALIQSDNKLYFRGNFNKSRYCTDPASNFAQMAIDSVIQNKPAPYFSELAVQSYGCQIPNNDAAQPNIQ